MLLQSLAKRVMQSTKLSTSFSENQTHVGSDGYKLQICLPAKFKLWTCLHVKIVQTSLCVLNEEYHYLISFTLSGTHFGNHCSFRSQSSSHDALIRPFTPESHQEFLAMYSFARFWEPRNEAVREQKQNSYAKCLCTVMQEMLKLSPSLPHEVCHARTYNHNIEIFSLSRHFERKRGAEKPEAHSPTSGEKTGKTGNAAADNFLFAVALLCRPRFRSKIVQSLSSGITQGFSGIRFIEGCYCCLYFELYLWNDRNIMPLFDVIGLGGEKHAVVIDIGAAYTK